MHGHQVGGTNPSLVEALGAGNAVVAHDNRFNRWVAGDGAVYFSGADGFARAMDSLLANPAMFDTLRQHGHKRFEEAFIRPSVTITYPWKVSIGDHAWVGDDVVLYSLGEIEIGAHAVVSQSSYLCAADHDYTQPDFPIRARKITIGPEAWVAADVFVAPGMTIGAGAVIGARSSVFKDMPAGMVCFGYPCVPVKKRSVTDRPACKIAS